MKKKIVIVIAILLLSVFLLCACGESYKTKSIETDMSDLSVSSNGGMAVKVGKYLYYINGYAGNTVPNNFGEVEKGAIARVELDEKGEPVFSTNKIIVSKNVYSSEKSAGLYVVGEYIYYSTPSVEKDKNGDPKTSEMALMRTKLDGTDTKIVKRFASFTEAIFKVVNGYVLYVKNNELREINLNSKKFDDKLISSDVTSYYMTEYKASSNDFINGVFYIKNSEVKGETHNLIWYYKAGSSAPVKVIEGNTASYPTDKFTLENVGGYTFAIVEAMYTGSNIRLFYTKTDSGENKTSTGTYSYDFDANLSFDCQKEVRYNYNSTNNYTKFRIYDENSNNMLAMLSSNLYLLKEKDGSWQGIKLTDTTINDILDIKVNGNQIDIYYLNSSSIIQKVTVYAVEESDSTYTITQESAVKLMTTSYNSTWLTFDKVGNYYYFFNSSVGDYTYYVNIYENVPEFETAILPSLLSKISETDKVTLAK